MATLNRRRFLLLSAVALIGAACSSTEAAGLRGNGTTFVPREETQPAAPEPTPSLRPAPTLVPTPAVREPIVAPDALPTITAGTPDPQRPAVPPPARQPPLAPPPPARRLVIPPPRPARKESPLGT